VKINGTTIPSFAIIPAIIFTFWLGGLSFQVNANDTEIKNQAMTPVRLALIEKTLVDLKDAQEELKEEAEAVAKEQSDKLDDILRAVEK